MRKLGTRGILLKAKEVGILERIRPDGERLRSQGFSISQPVVDAVLKQAGEEQADGDPCSRGQSK